MLKKVFSIITFVASILVFLALGLLTVDMIKEYNYINSFQGVSGADYLGLLFYRMFYCVTALPGIITAIICLKLTTSKPLRIISGVLLILFVAVFAVFGIAWLRLL